MNIESRDLGQTRSNRSQQSSCLRFSPSFASGALDVKKSPVYAAATRDVGLPLYEILAMTDLMREAYIRGDLEGLARQLTLLLSKTDDYASALSAIIELTKREPVRTNAAVSDNFDVIALLQEIVQTARLYVGNKPVTIMDVSIPRPLFVFSDQAKIRQIMSGIIHNAAKFTHRGRIAVIVNKDDGWVRLTVTDTGIGMTPEQINTLFTASNQARHDEVNRIGTPSQGLRMVMDHVTALKGKITVSSKLREGTIVEVSLPVESSGQRPNSRQTIPQETCKPV